MPKLLLTIPKNVLKWQQKQGNDEEQPAGILAESVRSGATDAGQTQCLTASEPSDGTAEFPRSMSDRVRPLSRQ